MIQASASAKAILLGEHSVVYGRPAIAVPVSGLRAFASAEFCGDNHPTRIVVKDYSLELDVSSDESAGHPLVVAYHKFVDKFVVTVPNGLLITIWSEIPPASGLGSGAAVVTALLRALSGLLGIAAENAVLNELVFESEKLYHGTPSGIDNTVIVYEQPVFYVKNQPLQTFAAASAFNILIADTGVASSTYVAVSDVRRLYEADYQGFSRIFDEIADVVLAGRQALETGDVAQLGKLFLQNHSLLQRLTVSSNELDLLVSTAVDAGAYGAKLSGGGRGGNIIALVSEEVVESVSVALLGAGAARVFKTVLV